jgi:Fe-S-cluster containining protein
MLMGDDDAPRRLTKMDDWGGEVMRRLDDGWCAALDRGTMLCTIYERRPGICRDYEMGDSDCLVERSLYAENHPGSLLLIAATVNS